MISHLLVRDRLPVRRLPRQGRLPVQDLRHRALLLHQRLRSALLVHLRFKKKQQSSKIRLKLLESGTYILSYMRA